MRGEPGGGGGAGAWRSGFWGGAGVLPVRRILARLLDLARWHRADRVFLEVRPSNRSAIALYHSAGFNEIGKRPNYYPGPRAREDALVMAMELLAPGH